MQASFQLVQYGETCMFGVSPIEPSFTTRARTGCNKLVLYILVRKL
jgi:hypothetical protein